MDYAVFYLDHLLGQRELRRNFNR